MTARTRIPITMIRQWVWNQLSATFGVPLPETESAIVDLHTEHEEQGYGALRVRWRGKGVLRFFAIEQLDDDPIRWANEVIGDIGRSLHEQLERVSAPANEDR